MLTRCLLPLKQSEFLLTLLRRQDKERHCGSVRCSRPLWLLQMPFVFLAIYDRREGSRNRCQYRCCTPHVSTYEIPLQWEHNSDLRDPLPGEDDWQLWLGRGLGRSFDPGGLPECPRASDVVLVLSYEAVKNMKVLMASLGLHCSVLMLCMGQHLSFWDLITPYGAFSDEIMSAWLIS